MLHAHILDVAISSLVFSPWCFLLGVFSLVFSPWCFPTLLMCHTVILLNKQRTTDTIDVEQYYITVSLEIRTSIKMNFNAIF